VSIHEVHYDDQGRIISARCVDEEIDLHRKNPQPEDSGRGVIMHNIWRSPDITEVEQRDPESVAPARIHKLTAVNKSTVIETDHELGFTRKGFPTMTRLAPAKIFRREEIASARIKNGGYVWTEPGQQVDVYAPLPRPGFLGKLRTALAR
jgi:hypothetical protein